MPNNSDHNDTQFAVVCGVVAVLFALILVCNAVFGQERRDYSGKAIVMFSPSYFQCQYCDSFRRHEQMLKRQYPGLVIGELKVTEQEAKDMGLTGFPTLVVGERLTGFDAAIGERIRGAIER